MSLAGQVTLLAARIAAELKLVRGTLLTLASDQTSTSVTAADVTGLQTGALAAGLYEVEGVLLVQSAATTTGVQIGLAWGAASAGAFKVSVPISATADVLAHITAGGQKALGTAVAAVATSYPVTIKGTLRVPAGGLASPGLRPTVNSEVASSQVTVKADSWLRYRKIA